MRSNHGALPLEGRGLSPPTRPDRGHDAAPTLWYEDGAHVLTASPQPIESGPEGEHEFNAAQMLVLIAPSVDVYRRVVS